MLHRSELRVKRWAEGHLRQLAEAVQRVDVRGLEVRKTCEGLIVKLDAVHGGQSRALAVGDVWVQGDGMADELDGGLCKPKVRIQLVHGHDQQIAVLVRVGVGLIVLLHVSAPQ